MSPQAALAHIVAALDAAGIPHMVAGSFASTFHGDPRTTQDIDLVIDPTRDTLDRDYIERWTRELGVEGLWERVSR